MATFHPATRSRQFVHHLRPTVHQVRYALAVAAPQLLYRLGEGKVLPDLAEEDLTKRATSLIESDEPVNRLTSEAAPVGELRGPLPERLVQVHERVVQIEEREPLHDHYPTGRASSQSAADGYRAAVRSSARSFTVRSAFSAVTTACVSGRRT